MTAFTATQFAQMDQETYACIMKKRPHILVGLAEDASELELLGYFLRGAGFRVTCTHDVASSLRVLQTKAIDIVIIDAVLADGAGTSVAAYATWLGIPATTITRSPPLHDVRRRHAFIRGPVSLPVLRETIDTALGRRDEIIVAWQQVCRLSPHIVI
jgi:DNA-binding NtrC family response regulator